MQDMSKKVYLIGKTALDSNRLNEYMQDIGSPDWSPDESATDAEVITEVMGRICYRSWQPYDKNKPHATNENVKRVRKGNARYVKNLIEKKHGSVLEHCTATFIFRNVSRVLTHELVRHRAGMAYSQESLRYVLVNSKNMIFELPKIAKSCAALGDVFTSLIEIVKVKIDEAFKIVKEDKFLVASKKQITSALRRLLLIGTSTTIGVTGNLRAWRHILSMRTSSEAEEEISDVMFEVGHILKKEFPNIFIDMSATQNRNWVFENEKV